MKRIVNGVTYNTTTSTALATSSWEPDEGEIHATLYQTRGGAFYVVEEWSRDVWNERERQHEIKITTTIEPMSPEKAHEWIMTGEVEIIKNPFDDPPEAEAEAEPGATIYIRVPASLKHSVDEAAKAAKVSGNVWAMRCVEKCLKRAVPDALAQAFAIAATGRDDNDWDGGKIARAFDGIADLISAYTDEQCGKDSLTDVIASLSGRGQIIAAEFVPWLDQKNSDTDLAG
jgi:hypothetical protein